MSKQAKNKQPLTALILGLGLTLGLLWMVGMKPVLVVHAANFTVTKFIDTNDGACNTDCSLREAIIAANASGDPDTITLMAGTYILTIGGSGEDAAATGDLDITAPLTITGVAPDQTLIDGGDLDRVFDIRSGTVVISGITIANGDGFVFGGGILNEANLTLINSTINNNIADSGGGVANLSGGVLLMTNSTVSSNTSSGNGGGIVNFSDMTLTNSIVSSNTASSGAGGGISNFGGGLTMTNSTVSSNTASLGGGGIGNLSSSVLTLVNSTINDNTGGGIFNASASNLTVTNSTVSSNTASFGSGINNSSGVVTVTNSTIHNNTGGGIFNASASDLIVTNSTVSSNTGDGITNSGSDLTATNSTVSSNTASSGGGITNFSSGVVTVTNSTISSNTFSSLGSGINNFSGVIRLKNTIVANNTTDDCLGTITSNGHNLDRDGTCNLNSTEDLSNTNPVLGPLQNNGGDTKTHALMPGSPAIDAADNVACPTTDQRGFPRPIDGDINGTATCDIGAYEEFRSTIFLPIVLKGS